jgi:hypothetical protein
MIICPLIPDWERNSDRCTDSEPVGKIGLVHHDFQYISSFHSSKFWGFGFVAAVSAGMVMTE